MLSALIFALGTLNITLDHTPYHVAMGSLDACLESTDVHRLTGSITAGAGSHVAVHVDNGTMPDYTITFKVNSSVPSKTHARIDLNATWYCSTGRGNATKYVTGGIATTECGGAFPASCRISSMQFLHAQGGGLQFIGLLRFGPNPPPPPPPPPSCATSYSQADCDEVASDALGNGTKGGACSWCVSDDGLHAACFDAAHKPDASEWRCDRSLL